jgi:hypothetical protein
LPSPLHGDLHTKILRRVFGHGRGNEQRPDRSGCDRVGANFLLSQQLGESAGKVLDRPLGRSIDKQNGIWHVRVDGCGIDDGAARLHVRHGSFGQIDAWMLVSKVSCHSSSVMSPISFEGSLVSGVVDQDVDAAEFVDSAPDDGSAVIRVSQVAGNERGLASLLLDECLHFLGVLPLAEIRDQDVGALAGIGDRDGSAFSIIVRTSSAGPTALTWGGFRCSSGRATSGE